MKITTRFIISSLCVMGLTVSPISGGTFLLKRGEQSLMAIQYRIGQALNLVLQLEISRSFALILSEIRGPNIVKVFLTHLSE